MAPATEIATWTLPAGASLTSPSFPASKILSETLSTVSAQPGYQRAYYGTSLEDPTSFHFWIDWDSYSAHKTFTESTIYGPFVKHLMPMVDGDIEMRHAEFSPHPPSIAVGKTSAPVTEVLTAYLEQRDEGYAERTREFGEKLKGQEGLKGFACGWVLENVEHTSLGEGKKGKALVSVFGWESKEHHMQCRESEVFKENIHLLREGTKGLTMHHVSFDEK